MQFGIAAAASASEASRRMVRTGRERSPRKGGRPNRRSAGGNLRRVLGVLALVPLANRAPIYARLLWALVRDGRTSKAHKTVLAGALGYVVLGRDLIPDDLPVVGGMDDLVVVALALDVFMDGIDEACLTEHLVALEIDRDLFDADVARLRRVLPGPVRRMVRRLPGLAQSTGQALRQTGLGPRLRGWINKEESLA